MLPVVLIIMRDMQRVLHASLFHVPATSASLTVLLASVVIAPHRHRWAAAATAIAISLLCDAVGHTWGRVYRPHTTAVGLLLTTALLPAVPAPNDTKGQQKVPSPALPRCMPPVLATATISPPGTPAGSPRSSVASGGARGSSGASSLRAFQQQLAALQAPSRADVQLHWREAAVGALRRAIGRERMCLAQVRQAAAAQRADALQVAADLEKLHREVGRVSTVLQERVAVGHQLERALAAGTQRLAALRTLETTSKGATA